MLVSDRRNPKKRAFIDTPSLILTGAGIYMIIMLGIGFYASRGSHSVTDFIVAGRSLPIWICSVSIFATWFGSGIMMGAATSGYDQDFLLMIGEPFGSGLALLLSGLFFARIMRRARRMTWVEFFEARYGKFAGVFGAFTDILSGIIWLGGVLFTFGILLESLTGLPNTVGIFGGLIVIVIYTMVGGMWAVALTDFIQVAILAIGLVVLSVIVLDDVGGWAVISEQLPKDAFRFFPVDHTYKNWIEYIHVWMTLGISAIAANSVIQRALSARTEMVAQNSFLIAAVAYVVIGSIPIMLGMVASVTMPGAEDANSILTDIAVAHMQPIFVVLFVGAILSSIMSTSDSILLSSASVISTNLLPRVVKNPGDELRLRVTRWSIPFVALAATYIAFGAERVVEVLIQSAAPLLAMTIVPFVLCFWWEKANRCGALGGIFGGLAGWLISAQFETVTPPDLIGFAVSLIVMVVVTLLTQRVDPPRPITDDQGNKVELKNRVATFRSAS